MSAWLASTTWDGSSRLAMLAGSRSRSTSSGVCGHVCMHYDLLGWLRGLGFAIADVSMSSIKRFAPSPARPSRMRLSDKGVRLLRPSLFSTLASDRSGQLQGDLTAQLLELVAQGVVKPHVHKVLTAHNSSWCVTPRQLLPCALGVCPETDALPCCRWLLSGFPLVASCASAHRPCEQGNHRQAAVAA
jgi:hypothetical protein